MKQYRFLIIGAVYIALAGTSAALAAGGHDNRGHRNGSPHQSQDRNRHHAGRYDRRGHHDRHGRSERRGHAYGFGHQQHRRGHRDHDYRYYQGHRNHHGHRGYQGQYDNRRWQGYRFDYRPHNGYYTRDRWGRLQFHRYR